MLKDFLATYFKRTLVILPFVAIVILIPPYPLDVKLLSTAAFFIVLLIPQLVEVLLIARNRRNQQAFDASNADLSEQSDPADRSISRKERRIRSRMRGGRRSDDR